ncbi:filamentous hemagglutinin family protein [Sphingomonas sp. QA11]|uniref:filamentous haemagglutinin family protein n=1 Tax=Sphingomonas sp. QA11 TaxID=2950605 RepID=UPI00234B2D61|nr:filamentous haemagglutinin family protein [Sphingomonas sp. QA11]WCM25948.1 filamentous hemagglutinin family protein [Sphingomonas sp. QA11]
MSQVPSISAKRALLSGASLLTLLVAHPALGQTLSGVRATLGTGSIPVTPGASGGAGSSGNGPRVVIPGVDPAQAAAQAQKSVTDFNAALTVLRGQLAAQAQARAVTSTSNVPNGLTAGGLAPVAALSGDPALWQNANAATETKNADGTTTVTIGQTASKAILTWDSFNVGKDTIVHFDQTGGTQTNGANNWVALNRIVDPSGKPSQILGQIKAEGSVYLINRNGILFGGTSQVNTHSLVVSSLSFLGENISGLTPGTAAYDQAIASSNITFLNTGIAAPESTGGTGFNNLVLGVGGQITGAAATAYEAPGDVVIQSGAQISTHANGSQGNGGYVLIAGTNVDNAGQISTPGGQAILAAGAGVGFWRNVASGSSILLPKITGQVINPDNSDGTPISTLTNTGIIQAARGTINLLGTNVDQNGVVEVTTGVSYPGSIVISAVDESLVGPSTGSPNRIGLVTFGAGSLTASLPEEDGETATSSPAATFTPGSIGITGGAVWFHNGSLLEAPGAAVTVAAMTTTAAGPAPNFEKGLNAVEGRILVDTGATIDVAGLTDVQLSASAALATIKIITQNEIADDPDQIALLGLQNIVIDTTLAGTTADGKSWVGSPILNASGYAQLIPRKIDQLLVNAGSITLAGNEVLTASGSMLNLDGGYVHYLAGAVQTTRLVDLAGNMTAIGDADPNDIYIGIAGVTAVDHNRWGVTDSYYNPLLATAATYRPASVAGGNAGTLTIYGEKAVVLDGTMSAHAVAGINQVAAGSAPSGTVPGGSYLPTGGTFDFGDGSALLSSGIGQFYGGSAATIGTTTSIIIQNSAPTFSQYASNFDISTTFNATALGTLASSDPNNVFLWETIPADMLNAGGFANVKINPLAPVGRGRDLVVAQGATLSVQPGGSITYKAPYGGNITVLGSLIAPAGTINLETDSVDTSVVGPAQNYNPGSITVGTSGVLSTAGLWVNDSDLLTAPGADAFVNGGSVSLSAGLGATIDLERGSLIDVSSGGVLLAGGLLTKNGVPEGLGGSVTLSTWNFHPTDAFGSVNPPSQPTTGTLVMDGTIRSAGFSGGGTLTLQALGFQIGGDVSSAPAWDVVLSSDFFATQGFGAYQINALYDAKVADGAQVRLTQQTLIPDLTALASAPTGVSLATGGLTSLGALDPYHRQATSLTLTAGGDVAWLNFGGLLPHYAGVTGKVTLGAGALIDADAGASVTLGGSDGVTVLGAIRAPGGAITLTGDTYSNYAKAAGLSGPDFTAQDKAVWLGSNALLDVSGVAITDPYASPVNIDGALTVPTVGKVLAGGVVTLSDATGSVVAEAGSVINISGTSATFDAPSIGAGGVTRYTPQAVWSNAGAITLGAGGGLYFDGTLKGAAGASQAEGGTLTLLPETVANNAASTFKGQTGGAVGATGLILQQSGSLVPAGLAPGDAINPAQPGAILFSADRLDGSGISTLVLGGTSANPGVNPTVAFAGDVSLDLGRAVIINAPEILALPAGTPAIPTLAAGTTSTGGAVVSITAPYVALAGPNWYQGVSKLSTAAMVGDATLSVNAGFLDISNQVALGNFGQSNLTSSGDTRLSTTNVPATGATLMPGVLLTSGNLTLSAADLYPASGESFALVAAGPNPTTIIFASNGASSTPLSAGGALLVDATTIVQGGTIRAPFGSITLGVGDPTSTATQAAFGNVPLVATNGVTLTAGSVTSVSAGNATLPYGVTTDGTNWTYPAILNGTAPTLAAPPSKIVTLNGQAVSLDKGATVDLSGGGTLQAEEWIPGTGGTRDLLSQYSISYATSTTGTTTPLYPDARNVYAVVPGYSAPVAAYDPVFAQQPDPASQGYSTSLGVGQAGSGDLAGKAVYLSGVPGLPAGVYTLLPAKYATLPGAFRVVENSATAAAGQSTKLADGTNVVAGYFADALTGARSATPALFDVQSAAVWGKSSQYTLTTADSYFASHAVAAGIATPALPRDAGQLVLAATGALSLGAALDTTPGKNGAAAQVDIASRDIQIIGSGEQALAGYLQISAADLDALGAGSLLIGGVRSQTSAGTAIDVVSNSIVVSTDAADPLTGPEVLLVAKSDPTGADPNAANGLWVQSGSVIAAKGSLPASGEQTLILGDATHSGDGALLRVSNGTQVGVTRTNAGPNPQGLLTVSSGVSIDGGAALTLDSSGNLSFDPAASFAGANIAVDAPAITFTSSANPAGLSGFVVGPNGLAQFASAKQVDLRSFGDIVFDGDVSLGFGQAVDLSAGHFVGDGHVILSGTQIAFTNDLGAPTTGAPVASNPGSLTVNASEIDLGAGAKALAGFGAVAITATGGIVGQGKGSFDMGGANTTLTAPVFLADTGSAASLSTTGSLTLAKGIGTALSLTPIGGALSLTGGSIAVNGADLSAPAGNLSLAATTGDLTIGSGSILSSAGVAKTFYDTVQYAPGGYIHLTADTGVLDVQSGATLDFSGASGGGAAGSLSLSGPAQAVQLAGTIKGNAATGYTGGSLSFDTGGAVDLDNLATLLASSGVNNTITVHSRAGNLTLSTGSTIKATSVALTADGGAGGQDPTGGNILIAGAINASGVKGGTIALYGKSGVDLEGSLLATGSSATTRGGTVEIGTVGNADIASGVVQLDPTYGYELVSAANSGAIRLGDHALIDVSGGTAGGLSGGTVNFRTPLLANGDVNVTVSPTATVKGSRATTLEAFATWSTDDPITYGAGKHFDGLVDPAGWYNADGTMVAGTWTDQSGNTLSNPSADQLANYLTKDYFTPTAANADHQTFYGYVNGDQTQGAGTLMGFVENLPIDAAVKARFANIQNFAVTPGIELDNPDPAVNGGNITVLTNWNLGAGTSPTQLAYRFNGQAPTITFKAENDFQAKASLSDGFFQIANPLGAPSQIITAPPLTDFGSVYTGWTNPSGTYQSYGYGLSYYGPNGIGFAKNLVPPPVQLTGGDPQQVQQYYALYQAYENTLLAPIPVTSVTPAPSYGPATNINQAYKSRQNANAYYWGVNPGAQAVPTPPTAAQQAADPKTYLVYLATYNSYVDSAIAAAVKAGQHGLLPYIVPLSPPEAQPDPVIPAGTQIVISSPAPMDNSPSPAATAANPAPLLSAGLSGGASASYRFAAGAVFGAADPMAVQLVAAGVGGGNVTLEGHTTFPSVSAGQTINVPTMIRTGTGSIVIASAQDVSLLDQTAPGVIYTAGAPAEGAPVGTSTSIVTSHGLGVSDVLATNAANPNAAGDISIDAGNDILGVENVQPTSAQGLATSQFWFQWMQTGNLRSNGQVTQSSINFGAFDQGIMSVGGNIAISAGGNIQNLSVSLPTSWYLSNNGATVNTVGGGDLSVIAGGDILAGSYFVAKGMGTITAGGQIASGGLTTPAQFLGQAAPEVSTILALQDGVLTVTARQGADIGAVVNPSYLQGSSLLYGYGTQNIPWLADAQSYSGASTVNIAATTGDVTLNSLASRALLGANSPGTANSDDSNILPATVALTAFNGSIAVERAGELYPSATGQLSLIANQSINLSSGGTNPADLQLGLIDAAPSALPSPLSPMPINLGQAQGVFDFNLTSAALIDHSATPLHAADAQPVRLYALNGSIVDGINETSGQSAGFYDRFLTVAVDKPALIYAGQDIINLDFLGQNLRQDDITRIVAGRDIASIRPLISIAGTPRMNTLDIGGPGAFDVEAGRDIRLVNTLGLTPTSVANANKAGLGGALSTATGIVAVGNANNPYLPQEGADVDVIFGVAKGVDNAGFIAAYVDPAVTTPAVQNALVAFMEAWGEGAGIDTGLVKDKPSITLTTGQAWAQFQALPAAAQQRFNRQILASVLREVGADYNDPSSPYFHQYARGYQAINTLFPASLGYTANSLNGGAQGALTPVSTGNLDIRSSTIQTQQGGNVNIMGPGGGALVGGNAAPPPTGKATSTQGVLTLEQGAIDIFTDTSLLLAQSRIFTEQGGAITIWSSNGDVNAGKGAKTTTDVPPPIYVCSTDFYCTLDARGQVSGAGIATLQTLPGAASASVELIAPRGTVDFGAAGVRSSGNLIVAAQYVVNAANAQVQGQTIGVPTNAVNVSANLAASNSAAAAATQAAEAMQQARRNDQPSIFIVTIDGFGPDSDN